MVLLPGSVTEDRRVAFSDGRIDGFVGVEAFVSVGDFVSVEDLVRIEGLSNPRNT